MPQFSQDQKTNTHTIRWKDIGLSSLKEGRQILSNLYGCVRSGEFLSIMGPSGAGKTSLLSIIAGRLSNHSSQFTVSGQCLLNQRSYNIHDFSKVAAYVQQEGLLFGTLSVRQIFYFHANLKLWRLSKAQKKQKCQEIIKKLNLMECADTLIGNSQFHKCISGGQKGRVCIGLQLISNPSVLILDEPTSGLDSHNALIITKILSRLAKVQKKLIIATIHQPSTLMFQNMQQLYVLNKGSCVYQGPADKIVAYMCQLGIKINYRMNPADLFMMQISSFKQRLGYRSPLNSFNYHSKIHSSLRCSKDEASFLKQPREQLIDQTAPISCQFFPLMKRSFVSFYRLPSNQSNKLVAALLIPCILGLMFFGIVQDVPASFQEMYFLKLIAFVYMSMFMVFALNIYDTTLIFPLEKEIVLNQVSSGLYSIPVYFVTRAISELLGCLIPTTIYGIVLFFSSAMEATVENFTVFVGVFMLMGLLGYFFGIFFGILCKNEITAINLLPMVLIPMLLFGGPAININSIPTYIRWFQYLSPVRHSVLIIFQNQMKTSPFKKFTALNIPQKYGLDGDYQIAIICLYALLVGYFTASILLLYIFKKRRS